MVPIWRQPGPNLPHLAAPLQTIQPDSFEQCGLYPCIKNVGPAAKYLRPKKLVWVS